MKYFIILSLMLCISAHAGLVITKKKVVKLGQVSVKGDKVVLAFSMGEMSGTSSFKKSALIWYTTQEKVTTYYLGAKYAYYKKEYKISKFLAEQAIQKEPETKEKAQELIIFIDKLDKIKTSEDGDEDSGDY